MFSFKGMPPIYCTRKPPDSLQIGSGMEVNQQSKLGSGIMSRKRLGKYGYGTQNRLEISRFRRIVLPREPGVRLPSLHKIS